MVRNTHGGNKSKGMARKNMQGHSSTSSAQLRFPNDEFEQIASVTRLLGNGMFYATNTLGDQLLCHIRNKFKGRSRRNNDVIVGKLVLIGLRDWEQPHKNADLLFVYDDSDFHTLSSKHDLSSFITHHHNNYDNLLDFSHFDDLHDLHYNNNNNNTYLNSNLQTSYDDIHDI